MLLSSRVRAVSDLDKDDRVPCFMRYVPKEGEQLIKEEIYILDVDWF